MGRPKNTRNSRHTRKYPKYPKIPESKTDTRKYPIVFFDTPTRPGPDPLPGILSNTRPDPILKNPTRWALLLVEPSLSGSDGDGQGCIFRWTCSHRELTKYHVLTSAYGKIFITVTRHAVNRGV